METSDLISRLSKDSRKSSRSFGLLFAISCWVLGTVLLFTPAALFAGSIPKNVSLGFYSEALFFLAGGIACGVVALVMSVPGRRFSRLIASLVLVSFGYFITETFLFFTSGASVSMSAAELHCSLFTLTFGAAGGVGLLLLVRRFVPDQRWIVAPISLATVFLGTFVMHFSCDNRLFSHVLIFHFGVIAPLLAAALWAADGILGWRQKIRGLKKQLASR